MNPELLTVLLGIILVVPPLWLWVLEIIEWRKHPDGKPFYKKLWRPIIIVGALAGLLFWLMLKLAGEPVEFWGFFLAGLFGGIWGDRIFWYIEYRKRNPRKPKTVQK